MCGHRLPRDSAYASPRNSSKSTVLSPVASACSESRTFQTVTLGPQDELPVVTVQVLFRPEDALGADPGLANLERAEFVRIGSHRIAAEHDEVGQESGRQPSLAIVFTGR